MTFFTEKFGWENPLPRTRGAPKRTVHSLEYRGSSCQGARVRRRADEGIADGRSAYEQPL